MLASLDASDGYVRRDALLALLVLGFAAAIVGFGVTHHAPWDPHELDAHTTPLIAWLSGWLAPRRAHAVIAGALVLVAARTASSLGGRRAGLLTACVALSMPGLVAGARLTASSLEPALAGLMLVGGALGRPHARRRAVDLALVLFGAVLLCLQEPNLALAPALAVGAVWLWRVPRAAWAGSLAIGVLVLAEGAQASVAPTTSWARPLEHAVYAALPWVALAPWALFALTRRRRAWPVLAWLVLDLVLNEGRCAWLPVALAVGCFVSSARRVTPPQLVLGVALALTLALDVHRDLGPLASVGAGGPVDPSGVGEGWRAIGLSALALTLPGARRVRPIAGALALIVGAVFAHGWLPALSAQLGHGALFAELPDDASLAVHGMRPEAAARWEPQVLGGPGEVLPFLAHPTPRFVATPRSGWCALRQTARARGAPPNVTAADARFVMLSNRAGPTNHDPLSRVIEDRFTSADAGSVRAQLEGVELVGVSFPRTARRGATVQGELRFVVTAPLRRDLRVLVHVDGPGARFQGDHDPAGGLCPSSHWRVGDHVTDRFTFEAGSITHAPGRYAVHVGLYWGAPGRWHNVPVLEGPRDRFDRVYVGELELR